ncbi:type II secretion system minor pseudopilin GspH [Bermanella sp. WJH001]|uniref:type II secretion system minor pseudopilin GspH n=1 Tax=Bermanella sp. WJH001 TaxID=3048005 RepID=UPI0024BE5437|nr:type II secretion system minor pseudopilin GspH [Bermanella sp. WJH001]MDJ1537051.1 type II secretion system minor pseudopilin GspH [Bermanella sp. WJH001]
MKHRSAGFTLIEILVVLVIIAMLVSMASINTSHDGRYDELKNQSEKIKFQLMTASDVALFENRNLGVLFSKTELQFYSYDIDLTKTESSSLAVSDTPSNQEYSWQPYTVRNIKIQPLPENMSYSLEVEGQEVALSYALKQDADDINPDMYLLAAGEQTPFKLKLSIEDFNGFAQVRGNGVGQFYNEVIREEE